MGTTADYRNYYARRGALPRTGYRRRTPLVETLVALQLPAEDTGPADRLALENDNLMDVIHAALGWFEAHPDALEETARLHLVPWLRRALHGEEAP